MLGAGLLATAGCAVPPPDDPEAAASLRQVNDPLEPLNRAVFAANIEADRYILRPVAYVYKEAVPVPLRNMAGNFLRNLKSPVTVLNAVLQGDMEHAGLTAVRFAVNTTLGFAGMVDLAAAFGIVGREEDFGQTLAVWGAEEGPYLMLPLLGPSSVRDAAGLAADYLGDPLTYLAPGSTAYYRMGATMVDARAQNYDMLNDLERTSVDFYVAARSLYRQNRRYSIGNGTVSDLPTLPGLPVEDDPEGGRSGRAPGPHR